MLFGIVSDSKNWLLNFVILIAKYFILMCRKKIDKTTSDEFQSYIEAILWNRIGYSGKEWEKNATLSEMGKINKV